MKIKKTKTKTVPEATALPADPETLTAELARARELEAAHFSDELQRDRARAGHGRDRADLAVENRLADLRRAEKEADVQADAELARMYREYRAAGERIRVRSEMSRSGEARALSLETLRVRNLWYLIPLLIGFGAWSTTGVQQGAARLMNVTSDSPVWWALWGLEALLIGVVCRIIVVRARLANAGGELAPTAERIAWGCLVTSIFLNLVAAVPIGDDAHVSGWAVPGAMFAHAIGPVGAALTAHLIGVFDKSIAGADPWHEKRGKSGELVPVPRLSEMNLRPSEGTTSESGTETASETASESGAEPLPVTVWPVPREGRPALTIVAHPIPDSTSKSGAESDSSSASESGTEDTSKTAPVAAPESTERIGSDQHGQPVSEAVAETPVKAPAEAPAEAPSRPLPKRSSTHRTNSRTNSRTNKGARVPAAARKSSSTARRTDGELLDDMVGLIDSGRLSEDASNRQVQTELGIGFERAKRIRELYRERLTEMEAADVNEALDNGPAREFPTSTMRPELAVVGGDR